MAVLLLGTAVSTRYTAHADTTRGEVYVKGIDYESLVMKVYKNGNDIVYGSTDGKTWNELEGIADKDSLGKSGSEEDFLWVDISWTSSTADTKYYLRGDSGDGLHEIKITFPKCNSSFKVTFNKVAGTFTFTGVEKQEYFYYRKATDSNGWQKVYFDGFSGLDGMSYADFLDVVEALRFKGAKLVCKLGQDAGLTATDDDPGERPSKEVSVTVSKYATAPSVKVNLTKLTLNTKSTMEYCLDVDSLNDSSAWVTCTKTMKLSDITMDYEASAKKAGNDVTIFFRVSATEKKPQSQIAVLTIPGQEIAPVYGTNYTVDYNANGDKVSVMFVDAKSTPYEYTIEKETDDSFDIETARWIGVTKDKTITFTQKTYDGATIYVRYKGHNASTAKNIAFALPSDYSYTTFVFPAVPD